MKLKTLRDIKDLKGKRVFVRVGFDVPLSETGEVKDDKRIRLALPTLNYLLEKGVSRIVLIAHVGRPKNNEPNLMTGKIAQVLSKLLNYPVTKVGDWGESGLPETGIVMLENSRFHKGEKSKDEAERDAFGKQLASLADIYVNEAFSNSHRAHASMTSVPKFIPAYAGFSLADEVEKMTSALENPKHPLVAMIGGVKADKIPAIKNLLSIADLILVAGALGYSLLKLKGFDIGDSKTDDEGMEQLGDMVKEILTSDKVVLPSDAVVADQFSAEAKTKEVDAGEIRKGWMALDIGPKTRKDYCRYLKSAKTILWFGPVGVFEMEPFAGGTREIGNTIADSGAFTIIGGGDSASAVKQLGLADKMSLVSTGGGASLTLIEGKELPALTPLKIA